MDPSQRLEDVEVKIAFLEKYVLDLDGVVREACDQLDVLRRELGRLRQDFDKLPATAPAKDSP